MPFSYAPMPAIQPVSPLNTLFGTIGGIQALENQEARNALYQEEMATRKGRKEVFKGYGETGDMEEAIKKMFPVDPEFAIKMVEAKRNANKEQLQIMKTGAEITKHFLPAMLNNPLAYTPFYNNYLKPLGLSGAFPAPESFLEPDGKSINVDRYNETMSNLIAAKDIIKGKIEKERTVYKEEEAWKRTEKTAESRLEAARIRSGEGQETTFVDPITGEPIKTYKGKVIKGGLPRAEKDYVKSAHTEAMRDVRKHPIYSLDAESDEARQYYEKQFDFHLGQLQGKEGKGTGKGGGKVEAIRQKLMQVPPERRQEALNRIRQNDPDVYEMLVGK